MLKGRISSNSTGVQALQWRCSRYVGGKTVLHGPGLEEDKGSTAGSDHDQRERLGLLGLEHTGTVRTAGDKAAGHSTTD